MGPACCRLDRQALSKGQGNTREGRASRPLRYLTREENNDGRLGHAHLLVSAHEDLHGYPRMNIMRMIVGTTVRAVVYRLVGLAFVIGAAALTGKAQAQSLTTCPSSPRSCDQGAALAAASDVENFRLYCRAFVYTNASAYPTIRAQISSGPTISGTSYSTTFRCSYLRSTDGTWQNYQTTTQMFAYWLAGATCASRPSVTASSPPWPTAGSGVAFQSGSEDCSNGCIRTTSRLSDGTWFSVFGGGTCTVQSLSEQCEARGMVAVFYGCQPPPPKCTSKQTKNPVTGQCIDACPEGKHLDQAGACAPDEQTCPAGQIRSPAGTCLPGDGQCAAGEARKKDGTCGKDSDGDGEADDDDEDPENDTDKESFSGGDNCNNPPSCSGSKIMCGQARIQWRIECNTRREVNIAGGACGATPICTGEKCNAMEYSQLLMQWRTACALEKGTSGGIPGEGGDEGEKIKPDFEGLVGGGDGDDGEGSVLLPDGEEQGFNESLISYGGGALGYNFSVQGQTFAMPQQILDFLPVLRWLIIAFASVIGIAIVWGNL